MKLTLKRKKNQNSNVVESIRLSESVQAVYERHSEAGSIMKDAYSNIMEDFVKTFQAKMMRTQRTKIKRLLSITDLFQL